MLIDRPRFEQSGGNIPQPDYPHVRVAAAVAKNADRRRAEREVLTLDNCQSDPSRGEDAPELAVREERDVSSQAA